MRYYNSITYGRLTEQQVFERIAEEIKGITNADFAITVGTDSQTHSKTKVVNVIAIHHIGRGGKFFYNISYTKRMNDVRQKVYNETMESIEVAKRLTEFLFSRDLDFQVVIHVDIGESKKGKTRDLINEIMGWVNAEGFEFQYKPFSSTASTIADRITK